MIRIRGRKGFSEEYLLFILLVLSDETAVKIEVESALVQHFAAPLLLVVLEDAFIDLNVARLPSSEQRRAILVKKAFLAGRF